MNYCLIITISILLVIGFCLFIRRNKKNSTETVIEEEKIIVEEIDKEEKKEIVKPERPLRTSLDFSTQCIRLLGGFMVKDRYGNDISSSFTPKLRFLLIMIILATEEHPDGISGDVIIQRLWSSKNKYAARNNRNVTLTKLRNIFEEIGHIEIINHGNYWKISFGEDVLCDYTEIMAYMPVIKDKSVKDEKHLHAFLDLLYRGSLLYRTDSEWLNQYKGHFSYLVIDLLSSLLKDPEITDRKLRIKIADTLLQHDYINEEALQIQCILLYEMGQTELMKSCYSDFCTNYANLLGIQYTKTLREIVKGAYYQPH